MWKCIAYLSNPAVFFIFFPLSVTVCVCVSMYAFVHSYECMLLFLCEFLCAYGPMHLSVVLAWFYMYVCVYSCVCKCKIQLYVCFQCKHVYVSIWVCACMCVCIFVCTCVWVYYDYLKVDFLTLKFNRSFFLVVWGGGLKYFNFFTS